MLDCKKIVADGHTFNLEKLSGPHSVVTSKYSSLSDAYHNTTYTLDVCQPLKKKGKDKSCPNGTRGKRYCSHDRDRRSPDVCDLLTCK